MSEISVFFKKLFVSDKSADSETTSLLSSLSAKNVEEIDDKDCILRVSYGTDVGFVRSNNEDSFYADGKCIHKFGESERDSYTDSTDGTHVFGLFDGMGGEDYGEAAAEITARTLSDFREKFTNADTDTFGTLMNLVCCIASSNVCDMIQERRAFAGGSTFTAVCLRDGSAYAYWIGDSRIYLFNRADGSLKQLTSDHTVAMAKLAMGEEPSPRDHHSLTHFIGMTKFGVNIAASACEPVKFGAGCALLLCSDGLTDMLTDDEIAEILTDSADSPTSPAENLIDGALACGGVDNVTCIVIEKEAKPAETPKNQGSETT
ncbi:MAG: protein phosphatase 2C domain-containing protein [Ruminococcus sp.]|nr:protein phosphatase 2C domain-containing protein [Ruminococcus sp.]